MSDIEIEKDNSLKEGMGYGRAYCPVLKFLSLPTVWPLSLPQTSQFWPQNLRGQNQHDVLASYAIAMNWEWYWLDFPRFRPKSFVMVIYEKFCPTNHMGFGPHTWQLKIRAPRLKTWFSKLFSTLSFRWSDWRTHSARATRRWRVRPCSATRTLSAWPLGPIAKL